MSLTVKEIFEQRMPERLQKKAEKIASINAIYQFNITGDEASEWIVDLTQPGGKVSAGTSDSPKCTVTISSEHFVNLIEGKLNPQMAFVTGKLKVKGDMGLALKLGTIL